LSIEMANLKAQHAALSDELDAAMRRVAEDCCFILGESVLKLEEQIASANGARFGVSVASGTDAILISLKAAGLLPGDEVITTPFTFVATTEAIVLAGAVPVYADVQPDTLNIDPAEIEKRITPKTKMILPVHLYGRCANMDAIVEIANRHSLLVIADAAQAIGAVENGKLVGEMGRAATLSFFPTKNLGAYGDGGMILTDDEELARKARSLRFHGMAPGSYFYEDIGYCSRLDELQAAILLVKLQYLESWNERRRTNAEKYSAMLAGLPVTLPPIPRDGKHVFHQFTIRYHRRDELQRALREKEVGSNIYYPMPLHLQPAYQYLGYSKGDFPIAEQASLQALSIPVYPELTDEEVEFVGRAVISALKEIEG
jgi:dTDP-4-amino-4,6-dideoxygalactose transaminase